MATVKAYVRSSKKNNIVNVRFRQQERRNKIEGVVPG